MPDSFCKKCGANTPDGRCGHCGYTWDMIAWRLSVVRAWMVFVFWPTMLRLSRVVV